MIELASVSPPVLQKHCAESNVGIYLVSCFPTSVATGMSLLKLPIKKWDKSCTLVEKSPDQKGLLKRLPIYFNKTVSIIYSSR